VICRDTHESRERGAVSAELVAGVPALLVVLALCLGGLTAATAQARAHEAATTAARLLARGAPESDAHRQVGRVLEGARLAITRADGLLCVRVEHTHRLLGLPLAVQARSCALDSGW
jgi:hypothetical protein